MIKTGLTIASVISSALVLVSAETNSYGAPQPVELNPYYSQYTAPYAGDAYSPNYNPYAQESFYKTKFLQPRPAMDPKYYQVVLQGFKSCMNGCDHKQGDYSDDGSLETLSSYTACITSCAASESMRVVSDFKNIYGKVFDIGAAQLAAARRYLAGEGEYDVLGERTRIDESCCLPSDYFVDFDRLVMWVMADEAVPLAVPVKEYLDFCYGTAKNDLFLGQFTFVCDNAWMEYAQEMQKNIGHLILAPKCDQLAPDGACCVDEGPDSNPRAAEFPKDMCAAYECISEDGKKTHVSHPILKHIIPSDTYTGSCPPEYLSTGTINFRRVPKGKLNTYTTTGGLPSAISGYDCTYNFGLMDDTFLTSVAPLYDEIEAAQQCPNNGKFEYCNMKQYVNFLQQELFDLGGCPMSRIVDHSDDSYTLACLYRVSTLKCDCMEAVLNCYESEYVFSSVIGKTLGKAASIMCGFILCQRPTVYSLFGGQGAINHASVINEVLLQVGALAPSASSLPPATFAFLSFGLGMVAFLVTKKAVKSNKSSSSVIVDDGYSNLI